MRSAENTIFNPLLLIKCLNMWVLRLAIILMGHKEDMPTFAQMPLSWTKKKGTADAVMSTVNLFVVVVIAGKKCAPRTLLFHPGTWCSRHKLRCALPGDCERWVHFRRMVKAGEGEVFTNLATLCPMQYFAADVEWLKGAPRLWGKASALI